MKLPQWFNLGHVWGHIYTMDLRYNPPVMCTIHFKSMIWNKIVTSHLSMESPRLIRAKKHAEIRRRAYTIGILRKVCILDADSAGIPDLFFLHQCLTCPKRMYVLAWNMMCFRCQFTYIYITCTWWRCIVNYVNIRTELFLLIKLF